MNKEIILSQLEDKYKKLHQEYIDLCAKKQLKNYNTTTSRRSCVRKDLGVVSLLISLLKACNNKLDITDDYAIDALQRIMK